jgi:hypothetical protein
LEAQSRGNQDEMLTMIRQFVARASGLRSSDVSPATTRIEQSADGKGLSVQSSDLEEVLFRTDTDGQSFIQVNFKTGYKILITDTLIGFKPAQLTGLDMNKIPKVVTTPDIITTPDIMSVFEALQEALYSGDPKDEDVSVLRRVFDAVVTGGEAVGFDLKLERSWLGRIPHIGAKSAA